MIDRNNHIDFARVGAAALVAAIHTSPLAGVSPTADFVLVNGLARLAVPFFLTVTGFYLTLNSSQDLLLFLKRIVWLHVVWSTIYLLAGWTPDHNWAKSLLSRYVIGYWHLWYLPAIAEASLCLWLIRSQSFRAQAWLIGLTYASGCAIEFWCRIHGLSLNLYRNGLFFALPFLWLGKTLREKPGMLDRIGARKLAWAGLGSFALLFVELYAVSRPTLAPVDMLLSLFPLTAIGVHMLMRFESGLHSGFPARLATGIYFSHVGVLLLLDKVVTLDNLTRFLAVLMLSAAVATMLYRTGDRLRLL